MLALSRNIPQAVARLKAGRWERNKYTGTELMGKTLAVIGLGRIGREVARWGRAFGMTTIGFDPIVSAAAARAAGIEPFPLEEVWAKADFVTLHTPMTKDIRHLINAETLKKWKKGVRIVNCARGGMIHEKALLEALESGHVAGASLVCTALPKHGLPKEKVVRVALQANGQDVFPKIHVLDFFLPGSQAPKPRDSWIDREQWGWQ